MRLIMKHLIFRLLGLSLMLILLFACKQDEAGIKTGQTTLLVDKQKRAYPQHILEHQPHLPSHYYRVYGGLGDMVASVPYISGFDEVYGEGGRYYLILVKYRDTRSWQDGGIDYTFVKVLESYEELPNSPFED